MKTNLKETSEIGRVMEISVPAEDIQKELDQVYRKIGGEAKLKGFRQGKVPRSVLEQNYREEAESKALQNLVSQTYWLGLKELNVSPLATPEITVSSFNPGQELVYQASFEIKPVIEPKDYQGLELSKESAEVTEDEVSQKLQDVRERMAQWVPPASPRPAKVGDLVTMDYEAFLEDKPIKGFKAKDYVFELGKSTVLPELETGLIDMTPDQEKTIKANLPQEFSEPTLAGREVAIKVTVREIKEKQLPTIDEEMAKDLNFASLEELKQRIRDDLKETKERASKEKLRRDLITQLIEKNSFPLPESLVKMELDDMKHQMEHRLRQQGVDLHKTPLPWDEFFERNRAEAVFRVQGALILEALTRKENITVSPEEIQQRLEEILEASDPSHRTQEHRSSLSLRIESLLKEEKTLDFVLSQSTIK